MKSPHHRGIGDLVATAVAGLVVGAALYPLTLLLGQVLAGACDEGGLESIGPCIFGWLASLVLAFVLLSVAAAVGLRLRRVPCAFAVAGLGLLTTVVFVWRVLYLMADLQQVLGAAIVWIGVLVLPAVYVAWLLLLTPRADGDRRIGAVAGMVVLVLVFAVPGTAEGIDRRRSEAEQLRWLASLPFTVYEPTSLPPDFWLYTVEGQYNSEPRLRLLYRSEGPLVTMTQSPPHQAFSPPEECAIFPSQAGHPCEPIASMPSGETIYFWSPPSSDNRMYGVRLGDTVVGVVRGMDGAEDQAPEPALVRALQSLRPIDPVDLGQRHHAARRERATDR